jgi:Zn-dependent peptidase ImmA (M78 family)
VVTVHLAHYLTAAKGGGGVAGALMKIRKGLVAYLMRENLIFIAMIL